MIVVNEAYRGLTPSDFGILAASLDEYKKTMGDDSLVDALTIVIEENDMATGAIAEHLAYHIVHDRKCRLEDDDASYCRTWSHDGSKRITVTIPKD